ncbi:MAG: YiiD C-terminal domain-containing protein [Gammaproteobacteria bacterium]
MPGLRPSLNNTDCAAAAARLGAYVHRYIPLVRHMQVRVAGFDAAGLTLTAPLAANINHQSTAFGGSLVSLATLACWGLTWLLLEQEHGTHIVISESHIIYLRPVTEALVAHCTLPDATLLESFFVTLKRRHKARLKLEAHVLQGKTLCARFTGTCVAYHENRPAA